jgi:ferritin-like metal-binding protein YciE
MKLSLSSSEAGRKRLEGQLVGLGKQEGELSKERALRQEAEKRLAEAESRMKRLSSALERSGASPAPMRPCKSSSRLIITKAAATMPQRESRLRGSIATRKSAGRRTGGSD